MATLNDLFDQFLTKIEPDKDTRDVAINAHEPVRKWLAAHSTFGRVHVDTFLAGSYRRRTSVTPIKDVDIVVICAMSEYEPARALEQAQGGARRQPEVQDAHDTSSPLHPDRARQDRHGHRADGRPTGSRRPASDPG